VTGDATRPALEVRDLYRFFRAGSEETLALRGVGFDVWPGETVAVVGPSGSGKSTLLNCLAGLDEPAGGSVTVAGQPLTHRPEGERARIRSRSLGILLQSGNLVDHLSVRDNVALVVTKGEHRSPRRVATALLGQVGLAKRERALPRELSGGEAVRAGLAVALANDPSVLIADEPTGELDGDAERRVLDLLVARAADGGAVLLVTHSPQVIAIADRVLTLADGVLADGVPADGVAA